MQSGVERGPRRAAVIFVFVSIALDAIALGVIAPVFVPLIEGFMHQDVRAAAAVVGGFGTVFALMQFVWMPFLGVLSDRFGRKPIIVLSNLGMAVDYAVMALAPNLAWLLAGRIVSGITSANAVVAGAYIADTTPADKRAAAFGMIGAAFGLGFVLGPAIGGLCGQFDPRLPFWVAGAMCLANGVYGAIVIPESLAPENRTLRFLWRKANPLGSLRLLLGHPELTQLSVLTFFSNVAGFAIQTTWVLYVTYRYGWQPAMTGLSLVAIGISTALAQSLVIGRFVRRFGERVALFAGITFGALGMAGCGLAPNTWWFFLAIFPLCLWGLAPAAGQAMMSRRVTPQQQGELQGAIGSLRGFAALFAPLIFTTAFGIGIAHALPGAAWYLGVAFLAVSLLPALRELRPEPERIVAGTA